MPVKATLPRSIVAELVGDQCGQHGIGRPQRRWHGAPGENVGDAAHRRFDAVTERAEINLPGGAVEQRGQQPSLVLGLEMWQPGVDQLEQQRNELSCPSVLVQQVGQHHLGAQQRRPAGRRALQPGRRLAEIVDCLGAQPGLCHHLHVTDIEAAELIRLSEQRRPQRCHRFGRRIKPAGSEAAIGHEHGVRGISGEADPAGRHRLRHVSSLVIGHERLAA